LESRTSRKRKPSVWRIVSTILLLLVLVLSATSGFAFLQVQETTSSLLKPMSGEEKQPLRSMRPFHILLIGVDERKDDTGRADALLLLSFNPKTDKARSLSIPRDLHVELENGEKTKINHTYAYGGVDETVGTVERLLEIDIPYYAKINMEGLIDLVDAVGGITVDNPSAFSWNDRRLQKDYAKGKIQLNGLEASGYARMRKDDPLGDTGRQIRQRQVLQAVVKKLKRTDTLFRYEKLAKVMERNIQTNVTFAEATQLAEENRKGFDQLRPLTLEGEGYIAKDGVWYFFANEKSLSSVQQKLDRLIEERAD